MEIEAVGLVYFGSYICLLFAPQPDTPSLQTQPAAPPSLLQLQPKLTRVQLVLFSGHLKSKVVQGRTSPDSKGDRRAGADEETATEGRTLQKTTRNRATDPQGDKSGSLRVSEERKTSPAAGAQSSQSSPAAGAQSHQPSHPSPALLLEPIHASPALQLDPSHTSTFFL